AGGAGGQTVGAGHPRDLSRGGDAEDVRIRAPEARHVDPVRTPAQKARVFVEGRGPVPHVRRRARGTAFDVGHADGGDVPVRVVVVLRAQPRLESDLAAVGRERGRIVGAGQGDD